MHTAMCYMNVKPIIVLCQTLTLTLSQIVLLASFVACYNATPDPGQYL